MNSSNIHGGDRAIYWLQAFIVLLVSNAIFISGESLNANSVVTNAAQNLNRKLLQPDLSERFVRIACDQEDSQLEWQMLFQQIDQAGARALLLNTWPEDLASSGVLELDVPLVFAIDNETQAQTLLAQGVQPEQLADRRAPVDVAGISHRIPATATPGNPRLEASLQLANQLHSGVADSVPHPHYHLNWQAWAPNYPVFAARDLLNPEYTAHDLATRIVVLHDASDAEIYRAPGPLGWGRLPLADVQIVALNGLLFAGTLEHPGFIYGLFMLSLLAVFQVLLCLRYPLAEFIVHLCMGLAWLICVQILLYAGMQAPLMAGLLQVALIGALQSSTIRSRHHRALRHLLARMDALLDSSNGAPQLSPLERCQNILQAGERLSGAENMAILRWPSMSSARLHALDLPTLCSTLEMSTPGINSEPFSTALESGELTTPMLPVLPGMDAANQRLVPLYSGGRLSGFWVFALSAPLPPNKIRALLPVFRDLGQLLPELDRPLRSGTQRWKNLLAARSMTEALQQRQSQIENRFANARDTANLMNNGQLVYNAYGQLQSANRSAEEILSQLGVRLYGQLGFDHLAGLLASDQERIAQVLKRVLVRKRPIELPTVMSETNMPQFHMRISPILSADTQSPESELNGFLIEIMRIEEFWRQSQLQSEVVRSHLKRHRLAWLNLTLHDLTQPVQAERSALSDVVESSLIQTEQAAAHIQLPSGGTQDPLNITALLEETCTEASGSLQEAGVKLSYPRIWETILVLADHLLTRDALRDLINALIDSSYADTTLRISVFSDRDVHGNFLFGLAFDARGAGHDPQLLQQALDDSAHSDVQLGGLQDALASLREAGVALQGTSEIGEGTHIELRWKVAPANRLDYYSTVVTL